MENGRDKQLRWSNKYRRWVSDEGKVFREVKGKLVECKLSLRPNGYLSCSTYQEGRRKSALVHRLVAEAFLPNPENKPTVDHINRTKTDNRVCNLRWATYTEQCLNSTRNPEKALETFNKTHTAEEIAEINFNRGSSLRGKTYEEAYGEEKANRLKQMRAESNRTRDRSNFKKVQPFRKVMCVETGEILLLADAVKKLNLKSKSSITNVYNNPTKRCKGFHWKVVD